MRVALLLLIVHSSTAIVHCISTPRTRLLFRGVQDSGGGFPPLAHATPVEQFDAAAYLDYYDDVRRALNSSGEAAALQHYITHGYHERRVYRRLQVVFG
jgi:hypothetical protein